jgi:hypothetical protein
VVSFEPASQVLGDAPTGSVEDHVIDDRVGPHRRA